MTFLDEVKTILGIEDVELLLSLSAKTANFETTSDEDVTLATLKSSVHTAINYLDILPALKDGDSHVWTAMPGRGAGA